ncbi:MAG TPA: hypothetical protein VED40_03945 [Azospirillaceae bacterium]|nr:hypothetical protein [Azospirillaceae bacterium]
MSLPQVPDRQEIEAALAALLEVLERSTGLVRNGGTVDLHGLDREAAQLCEEVIRLPPDTARAMLPTMDRILAALEGLERELRQVAGAGSDPEAERGVRIARAAAAYRKAEDPA